MDTVQDVEDRLLTWYNTGVNRGTVTTTPMPSNPAHERFLMQCDRAHKELDIGGPGDPKGQGRRRPRYAHVPQTLGMPARAPVEYDVLGTEKC